MTELITVLREAWAGIEWAGTVWTDDQACLFCGRHLSGLPAYVDDFGHKSPEEPPNTHTDDCQWVAISQALAKAIVVQP